MNRNGIPDVCSLGSGLYAQKEIAFAGDDKFRRSRIFWSILKIRITSSLVVSVFYTLIWIFSPAYRLIYIIQYITILANMADVVWLFQGMEDFRKTSIRNIIIKIASVLMVFLMVKTEDDVPVYIAINAVSALVSSLVLWLYIPKFIIRVKVPWDEVKRHIYPIITLFIPMIAIYVYTYVDKILLGLLSTEAQVGFYSNAERIVKLPMTVITSLGTFTRMINLGSKVHCGKNRK